MSGIAIASYHSVLSQPLGKGGTAPISNEDIGRVVAGVLAYPEPYIGKTLRPFKCLWVAQTSNIHAPLMTCPVQRIIISIRL